MPSHHFLLFVLIYALTSMFIFVLHMIGVEAGVRICKWQWEVSTISQLLFVNVNAALFDGDTWLHRKIVEKNSTVKHSQI